MPCCFSKSTISPCLCRAAHASGVAHGSSPGRLVAAPRFNRNSTIRRVRSALLGVFASLHGRTNGGGQGRLVEFEVPGVDVGAGVQKDGRDGPVSDLGAGVQKRLAEPVRSVWIKSASQQLADQCGRPRIGNNVPAIERSDNGWVGVKIEIEQFRVALAASHCQETPRGGSPHDRREWPASSAARSCGTVACMPRAVARVVAAVSPCRRGTPLRS